MQKYIKFAQMMEAFKILYAPALFRYKQVVIYFVELWTHKILFYVLQVILVSVEDREGLKKHLLSQDWGFLSLKHFR